MSTAVTPGEFSRARQARERQGRRRRLWRWLAGVAAVVLVGVGFYLVFFSPVLAVRSVEVSGTRVLTADAVREVADVQLERPLARVDTDAVAERVRGLTPVAGVRVQRRFPSTLHIEVTERVAVYQIPRDGQHRWVDADGVSFHATPEPLDGVPPAVVKGEDQRLLRDVATVVQALPEELAGQVEQVRADAVDQISLQLTGNRQVVWGSAAESDLKAQVVSTLLTSVKAKVYDVSAPGYPTTR